MSLFAWNDFRKKYLEKAKKKLGGESLPALKIVKRSD